MMALGPLKHALAAAALGGALSAFAPAPAQAQFFFQTFSWEGRMPGHFWRKPLPERAILSVLRQDGSRRLSPPVLDEDVYVLSAIDPDGAPVRLVIDAFDGQILEASLRSRGPWALADPREAQPPAARPKPRQQAAAPEPGARPPPRAPRSAPQPDPQRSPVARPPEQQRPEARPPVASTPGTRAQPRVIPTTPPPPVAPLDDASRPQPAPTPYVPPAALE